MVPNAPKNNKSPSVSAGAFDITGQLPTLPHTCACSTIGAEELNYRVREGNGWVLLARVTQKLENSGVRRQKSEWAPEAFLVLTPVFCLLLRILTGNRKDTSLKSCSVK